VNDRLTVSETLTDSLVVVSRERVVDAVPEMDIVFVVLAVAETESVCTFDVDSVCESWVDAVLVGTRGDVKCDRLFVA
jgi:hypothetical protein